MAKREKFEEFYEMYDSDGNKYLVSMVYDWDRGDVVDGGVRVSKVTKDSSVELLDIDDFKNISGADSSDSVVELSLYQSPQIADEDIEVNFSVMITEDVLEISTLCGHTPEYTYYSSIGLVTSQSPSTAYINTPLNINHNQHVKNPIK